MSGQDVLGILLVALVLMLMVIAVLRGWHKGMDDG